jgi:hypothetical protein
MRCRFPFAGGARGQAYSPFVPPNTHLVFTTICERALLIRLTFLGRYPTKITSRAPQSPKLGFCNGPWFVCGPWFVTPSFSEGSFRRGRASVRGRREAAT